MRNVPFAIYDASIKPLKHKFPALRHKYREWVKAVGCRGGQTLDIAVIHEIQDDEEEENGNQ